MKRRDRCRRFARAGLLVAVLACLATLGGPSLAHADAEDLFIFCVGAGTVSHNPNTLSICFDIYKQKIARRSRAECRQGCRRLKRKASHACREAGQRGIVCRIAGRQINRACHRACRGKDCKAGCMIQRTQSVANCGSGSRRVRRCRRRARRLFRRCRRRCRR